MNEKVEEAVARAPCVFFLDEMDSFMIRNRSSRHSDYNIGIVNGLLEQLTRLNETAGVIVVGAANHLGLIDPAILRPGRFDLRHEIGPPDRSGIERILSGSLNADAGLDIDTAARRLVGCSGAAVAAAIREAKAQARRQDTPVSNVHLTAAIDRVAADRSDDEAWRIAVHEAGHVVVTWTLTGQLPSLVRLTPDGGEVHHRRARVETLDTARDHIAGLLAGRAAEKVILGSASSGAADDLVQATEMAFHTRHVWGLEGSSLMALPKNALSHFLPGTPLADAVDAMLASQATRAEEAVLRHQHAIITIGGLLLERAELTHVELGMALRAQDLDVEEVGTAKPEETRSCISDA
ncbi:Peptidase family M41 [Puniceibacterium sediminis]|uniref:Peptidase family M41 n=2 Tax=Puniceibacterium sediminis TaxID=1608407 RepID=A0A238XZW5_9RHOB|nr:Peptidase family M41 [Puniceibacterium sediminis]